MKLIDLHSHWGTARGYPLRTPEELAVQERVWKSKPTYVSEAEQAAYFRSSNVHAILDLAFTKFLPLEEVTALHDYALQVRREHPDAVLGNWIQLDPKTGAGGVKELERCIAADASGFVGFGISGSTSGIPANDPVYDPFYKVCIEARVPVLILVGYTGAGAGLPGGKGFVLDRCHPRYVDEVAARFPELTIIAGRQAWPWQPDMIAILMHKRNVWWELHGWSPKYFTPDLKWEIAHRLQDRIMFGADYPLFRYEQLVAAWRAEGYTEEILAKVFYRNAEAMLATVKR